MWGRKEKPFYCVGTLQIESPWESSLALHNEGNMFSVGVIMLFMHFHLHQIPYDSQSFSGLLSDKDIRNMLHETRNSFVCNDFISGAVWWILMMYWLEGLLGHYRTALPKVQKYQRVKNSNWALVWGQYFESGKWQIWVSFFFGGCWELLQFAIQKIYPEAL